MSICLKLRKCEHCRRRYPYNPDTGRFGLICPKCGKPQSKWIFIPYLKEKGTRKF